MYLHGTNQSLIAIIYNKTVFMKYLHFIVLCCYLNHLPSYDYFSSDSFFYSQAYKFNYQQIFFCQRHSSISSFQSVFRHLRSIRVGILHYTLSHSLQDIERVLATSTQK